MGGALRQLVMFSLPGLPLIRAGDDLAALIVAAAAASGVELAAGDVVVIAQKIVSKAEGRTVDLATVAPSTQAEDLAARCHKDPRLVELVLQEAEAVLRVRPGVIIVAHKRGWVLANAGIDRSNVEGGADGHVLLLPEDPDRSAACLRAALTERTGADVAVIIADSIGRAWRLGTVGTAIGASGIACLADLRGQPDLFGRGLETSETGQADEVAAAASLLMGQGAEASPVVVVRGVGGVPAEGRAADLLRPLALDMFR